MQSLAHGNELKSLPIKLTQSLLHPTNQLIVLHCKLKAVAIKTTFLANLHSNHTYRKCLHEWAYKVNPNMTDDFVYIHTCRTLILLFLTLPI